MSRPLTATLGRMSASTLPGGAEATRVLPEIKGQPKMTADEMLAEAADRRTQNIDPL